jgi:hypothetical protein
VTGEALVKRIDSFDPRYAFSSELLFRLDVNEHLGYLWQFPQHGVLHQMSNAVSFAH